MKRNRFDLFPQVQRWTRAVLPKNRAFGDSLKKRAFCGIGRFAKVSSRNSYKNNGLQNRCFWLILQLTEKYQINIDFSEGK
jgi:hypothetical protein